MAGRRIRNALRPCLQAGRGSPTARATLAGGLKIAGGYIKSKISHIGLPYHPGQLCVLGNRQHQWNNGNR